MEATGADLQAGGGKRILVLCDDHWHPASTVMQGLSPLADQGHVFEWRADAREWSAAHMGSFPLVILSKSNNVSSADDSAWVTPDVESAFVSYVRNGNGLLVIHSGTAGYQHLPALRALMGGAFLKHPAQCLVTIRPLAGHPLTAGAAPFTVTDEHYLMQIDDADASVFMTSESDSGVQPAGWTRCDGAGRVCILTPGHNLAVWLQPTYQALLSNALRWCNPTQ
jgi:type 1 glutamine amidotransferase